MSRQLSEDEVVFDTQSKLSPCHCGAQAILDRFGSNSFFVCCTDRECDVETGGFDTVEGAAQAWPKTLHEMRLARAH